MGRTVAKLTMYQSVRIVLNKGRVGAGWGGTEGGQTSGYEINRYWRCMYSMRTAVYTALGYI